MSSGINFSLGLINGLVVINWFPLKQGKQTPATAIVVLTSAYSFGCTNQQSILKMYHQFAADFATLYRVIVELKFCER